MKIVLVCFLFMMMLFYGCASKTSGTSTGRNNSAKNKTTTQSNKVIVANTAESLGGGLIGASLDEQDRKIMEQRSPSTVLRMDEGRPLTINDVIELSQGGVSDDTILSYMSQTKSQYKLNQDQIYHMQNAGVSQRVINYMIDTGY